MKKLFIGLAMMIAMLLSVTAVMALTLGGTSQRASIFEERIFVFVDGNFNVVSETTGDMTCEVKPVANYRNVQTEERNNINATLGSDRERVYTFNYDTANQTVTIPVRAQVPENLPAVGNDLRPAAFQVGTLECTIGNTVVYTETLNMQRDASMFRINRIEAQYGLDFASVRRDADRIRNIQPGTDMILEVRMDNFFASADNVDLDTEVTLECTRDIDVLDTFDSVVIRSRDHDFATFDLEFPDDIARGQYDCTLSAVAFTDNEARAKFGEEWRINLEVERERDEITIESLSINPSAVTCTSRQVTAQMQVRNTGYRNDRRVKIDLGISALGILEEIENIDLDTTDRTRRTFSFSVPEDAAPGTYEVVGSAYSAGAALSDTRTVMLTVPNCGPEEPEQPRDPPQNGNDQAQQLQQQIQQLQQQLQQQQQQHQQQLQNLTGPPANVTVDATDDTERPMNGIYIALLALLIVVLLGGIVVLLVYLLKD